MTIIEQIKAEIERRIKFHNDVIKNCTGLNTISLTHSAGLKEDEELLSFLSTLEESERPEPYNPVYDEAYLNEKIKKATESWKGVDVDAMLAECRGYDEEKSEKPMNLEGEINRYLHEECSDDDEPGIHEIAEHFAKWGAEHLATSGKTLEIKPGDEVTINGHKIIYDKDKGYVTIVKSEESVPNDLEEAAGKSLRLAGFHNMETIGMDWKGGFIAGAKWQKEQMMKELRSYCLDEIERFQGTDEGSRATREVYYDIIGYLDNYERR